MNLSVAMLNAVISGGGTFQVTRSMFGKLKLTPVEFEVGYLVAHAQGLDNEYVLYRDTIEQFIIEHYLVDSDFRYLGLWQDPETGNWSIDSVQNILDVEIAFRAAEENRQKAIWSNVSKRALTV